METATTCPLCDLPRTGADRRGLRWSSQHDTDGVTWICPTCTRVQLWHIETGLPLEPATHLYEAQSPQRAA